jgi:hypothetical protein
MLCRGARRCFLGGGLGQRRRAALCGLPLFLFSSRPPLHLDTSLRPPPIVTFPSRPSLRLVRRPHSSTRQRRGLSLCLSRLQPPRRKAGPSPCPSTKAPPSRAHHPGHNGYDRPHLVTTIHPGHDYACTAGARQESGVARRRRASATAPPPPPPPRRRRRAGARLGLGLLLLLLLLLSLVRPRAAARARHGARRGLAHAHPAGPRGRRTW